MMFGRLFPTKKNKWRLGLQFLPYAIRLVEARGTEQMEVRKSATIPIDAGMIDNSRITNTEWLGFELEKKVKEWGAKGREVILSIPLPIVVIRRISIVKVAEKDIRPLLEIEMENTLHLPFQDPIFDYIILTEEQSAYSQVAAAAEIPTEEEKQHEKLNLLIVAAPRDVVEKYVETVRKAGLKPVAVDIEPLALHRSLIGEFPQANDVGVLQLHVTLTGIDAAIFSDGVPEFVRYILLPVPFYQESHIEEVIALTDQASNHMEATGQFSGYMNDMFAEVNRIMNFYQYTMHDGKQRIEQVIVTGEFGDIRKLANYLQERLSVPVLTPQGETIQAPDPTFNLNPYRIAIGLATKDVNNT
ncbi:type IV pilus biogenesis protein PilM [Brevibacillus ginsengisoli]|uniref:type IV pilus biogenesis protein PilM n=1 Tax=Brevibacillus ginsengisoli TaxID=363854 RepID=UPI003CE9B1A9